MYDCLNSWKRPLWVMTYTVTTHHHLNAPIQKLIWQLGASRIANRRQLLGIHTKLFLVLKDETPIEAFVGSQNLVAPTSDNLMVRVTEPREVRELIAYFNHFWDQAKPISTVPVESKPKTK